MKAEDIVNKLGMKIAHKTTLSDTFVGYAKMLAPDVLKDVSPEYRFHGTRRWRFDFAWPDKMIAVECDGMVWQAGGGRHNTDADREKINTAVSMGWRVLKFSGNQLKSEPEKCLGFVKKLMEHKQ